MRTCDVLLYWLHISKITDNFETCLKSTERTDYVDVKSA